MSMGGCLVKLSKEDFNRELENSLANFVWKLQDSESCTLEQAWDVLRVLTQEWVDFLGTDYLEEANLGESCCLIDSFDLKELNKKLENITFKELKEKINSDYLEKNEAYWSNVWTDEDSIDDLEMYFNNAKAFYKKAELENKVVLAYVG